MKIVSSILLLLVLAFSAQGLKYIGQWNKIPGGLAYISVDYDGRVWGCNSGQGIYTRDGPAGTWQKIPGGLKQISVRNGIVWGVNAGQGIYYRDGVGGSWINVPGGLSHVVSDDDGRVFGVNSGGNIYTRSEPFNVSWEQLQGALIQLDVMNGIIVGANSAGNAYWRDWNDGGLDGKWVQMDSQGIKFRHISIDKDGSLLGTAQDQQIFRKQSISEGSWEKIAGGLWMIEGKNGIVWGCNKAQGIYTMDQSIPEDLVIQHMDWKQIDGKLKQATVDVQGEIWGVNSADNIYQRYGVEEGSAWQQIEGGLKNVDQTNGQVWGVNSGDKIYSRSSDPTDNWDLIPGGLKQVTSDFDGTVWGVNSGDSIYTRQGPDGTWKNIPGGLKQVDVANEWVWGVNSANNVYKRKGAAGSWSHEKGSMKWITINYDGRRWGISADNAIYTSPSDAYGWQQVNGSLKQISAKGTHVVGVNANDDIYYANVDFDCGAVFGECGFSGQYTLICDKDPKIDFKIKSVYVPEWSEIKLYNQEQFEGQTAIMEHSVECIDTVEYSLLQKMGIQFKEAKNLKGSQNKSKKRIGNKKLTVNKTGKRQ